jgi:hypothetical protein
VTAVIQLIRLVTQQQTRSRYVRAIFQGQEQMTKRLITHVCVGIEQHDEFTASLRYSHVGSGSEAPILLDVKQSDGQLPTSRVLLRHNSIGSTVR